MECPGLHKEHAADPSFSEIRPGAQRLHIVEFPEEKEPDLQDKQDTVPFISE